MPTKLAGTLAFALAVGVASPAGACLDRAMLRRVLRQAHPDVRACAARHDLPRGRYLVRATIDMTTGKVEEVDVAEAPADIGAPARSCLEAAFTRLQFPAVSVPAPRQSGARSGGGRVSRVPAAPSRVPRPTVAAVAWPFVLTENG